MANHPSAVKRHKQSLKRRARNRLIKTSIRTAVKNTWNAVEAGDKELASSECKKAIKLLDSAAQKGVLHKANASRRVSRLIARVG